MASSEDAEKLKARNHIDGVCHRCGWRGHVMRVGRSDRGMLGASRTFRRLCNDCVDDLLRAPGADRSRSAERP